LKLPKYYSITPIRFHSSMVVTAKIAKSRYFLPFDHIQKVGRPIGLMGLGY